MKNKEDILKILKNLKEDLKKQYKVKKLGLFGSYTNDEQNETSDIEILVEFEEGADLIDFSGLALFLEEQFNEKVDFVPKNAIKEELRSVIFNQVIYP